MVVFPEFGAKLPLDNSIPTVILNNPAFTLMNSGHLFEKISPDYIMHEDGEENHQSRLKNVKVIFTKFDTQKKPTNTLKHV